MKSHANAERLLPLLPSYRSRSIDLLIPHLDPRVHVQIFRRVFLQNLIWKNNAVILRRRGLRPPCEVVVRYLLPAFRSLVAKELVERHNLSQVASASKLGTTQAAVSQYVYSKRGKRGVSELESIPRVRSAVKRIAREIAGEESSSVETTWSFCLLCKSLREQEHVCGLHRQHASLPKNCDMCLGT